MRSIAQVPGVTGVYIGRPTRRGKVRDEEAIVAHVRWKRDERDLRPHEIIPPTVAGMRTDVLEVGVPRTTSLDHTDPVRVFDSSRRGSLTVVARTAGKAVALTAGHVVLPYDGTPRISRCYPFEGGPEDVPVAAADPSAPHDGILLRGRFGGPVDWAVIRFDAGPAETEPAHWAALAEAPLPVRGQVLEPGTPVLHASVTRRKRIRGEIDGYSPIPVNLRVDGVLEQYVGVVVVRSTDGEDFSIPGDSGSLVVDDERKAWGVVIGCSNDGRLAFVLTLAPAIGQLGRYASAFFDL